MVGLVAYLHDSNKQLSSQLDTRSVGHGMPGNRIGLPGLLERVGVGSQVRPAIEAHVGIGLEWCHYRGGSSLGNSGPL